MRRMQNATGTVLAARQYTTCWLVHHFFEIRTANSVRLLGVAVHMFTVKGQFQRKAV